jgi:hypothetical protein
VGSVDRASEPMHGWARFEAALFRNCGTRMLMHRKNRRAVEPSLPNEFVDFTSHVAIHRILFGIGNDRFVDQQELCGDVRFSVTL